MKTISTLKKLMGASLLVLAGFSTSFAQSNAIVAPGAQEGNTTEEINYQLSLSENVTKSSGRYALALGATSPAVIITAERISEIGNLYNVRVPNGTPVSTVVYLTIGDVPFWHVTVADILGHQNSDPDGDVVMRPLDLGGSSTITNTDTPGNAGSTAITSPTVVNTGDGIASSLSNKSLPKIDLYPNPATDQISIVTEGEVLWGVTEIIDITGKKILEVPTGATSPANGVDRQTVMISQLKPGTYLLRFRTNKDVYTKRFQVAR